MQRELEAALPSPSSSSPLPLIVHAASSTARDYTPLQNLSEKMQGKLLILTGLVPGPISSTASAAEKLAKDMVHKLKFGVPVVNSGTNSSSKTQATATAATGGEMEVVEDEAADTTIVSLNERIGCAYLGLIDLDKQGDEPDLVTSILLQALALASIEAGNVPILLTTQDAYGTKPWATQRATTTIDILLSHGASPQCLVLCRCPPRRNLEATYLDLLQKGIKLAFNFHGNLFYPPPNPEGQGEEINGHHSYLPEGGPSDEEGAILLATLCQKGYASQLLLSPGVSCRVQLTKYGGFGFAHLHKNVLPRLRRLGVSDTDIDLMISKTVLALFAWWTPPSAVEKPVEMGKCSWCGNMFEMRENEYYHKFAFIYCRRKCYNFHYDHGWKEVVHEG